jgi:hypothetical protein
MTTTKREWMEYVACILGVRQAEGDVLDGPLHGAAALLYPPAAVTPFEVLAVGAEVAAKAASDVPPTDGIPSSGLSCSIDDGRFNNI